MNANCVTKLFMIASANHLQLQAAVAALREEVALHIANSEGVELAVVLERIHERSKIIHDEFLRAAEDIDPAFGAQIDNRPPE